MPRPVPGGSGFPVPASHGAPSPLRHPLSPRPRPTPGGCLILRSAPPHPAAFPAARGPRPRSIPGGPRRGWRRFLAQWELVEWLQNGYIYTNDTDFLRTPRGWREFKDFIPRARGLGGLSVRLRLRSGSPGCEVERRTRSSLCPTPLFCLRQPQRPFLLLTRTDAERESESDRATPTTPTAEDAAQPSPRPAREEPRHAPRSRSTRSPSTRSRGRSLESLGAGAAGTPAPSARLLVVLGTDYSR